MAFRGTMRCYRGNSERRGMRRHQGIGVMAKQMVEWQSPKAARNASHTGTCEAARHPAAKAFVQRALCSHGAVTRHWLVRVPCHCALAVSGARASDRRGAASPFGSPSACCAGAHPQLRQPGYLGLQPHWLRPSGPSESWPGSPPARHQRHGRLHPNPCSRPAETILFSSNS